jgi:hypothetical protein
VRIAAKNIGAGLAVITQIGDANGLLGSGKQVGYSRF